MEMIHNQYHLCLFQFRNVLVYRYYCTPYQDEFIFCMSIQLHLKTYRNKVVDNFDGIFNESEAFIQTAFKIAIAMFPHQQILWLKNVKKIVTSV